MRLWSHIPVVVMVALASSVSMAVTAEDKATARALATEGAEKFAAEDFRTALDRFSKANQIVPAPTIAIYVARCHVKLGQLVEAQVVYQKILAEPVAPKSPAQVKQAVKDAQNELDALLSRIPQIQFSIQGPNPSDTKVQIDGVDRSGDAGAWVPMNPGVHKLRAEAADCDPVELEFELRVSERRPIPVQLAKRVPAPVPVLPPPVPVPTYVAPPPPTPAPAPPPPPPSTGSSTMTAGYVTLGVGAAGLVAGGVLGLLTLQKKGDFTNSCAGKSCPPEAESDYNRSKSYATFSTVGFVVGGVLVATGVTLVAISPRSKKREMALVSPEAQLRVGWNSVALQGTF